MELSVLVVVVGLVAAFVFGVSKTAVPAVGAFGVALLATVLPAVPSTGVALPVLIVGDVFAIALYGRHAEWGLLLRLLPSVVVGLAAGWALVRFADPTVVTRVIGAVLLLSVGGALVRRRGTADDDAPAAAGGPVALLLGAGAGLSTMVANAGGPMMTLYLLRMRVGVLGFLGSVAWFFAAVNLLKVPFSVGLGLITAESLLVSAVIAPGAVAGALLGRRLVRGMSVEVFRVVALAATAVAGLWLVVR
ncbi:sulfite exporter TauE/SafE family protein [Actinotalea sp. Marseille-Q4924]|uniref:sulfite exporter TauE/SafE family protein n=1 Tax=Actinotalea sp. Marseille-Q4924 TaxID=2866571 RepID=UPI001CE3FD09|nr:sulfite exporter TauE/SafE family protein [Actinotalea sp. Marseille-Q4924]